MRPYNATFLYKIPSRIRRPFYSLAMTQLTKWCYVIVAAAMRKDLTELFSDPQASARCRLCRIRSRGSYLKLFCVVLVNLSSWPDSLDASFFVGVAFSS